MGALPGAGVGWPVYLLPLVLWVMISSTTLLDNDLTWPGAVIAGEVMSALLRSRPKLNPGP